MVKIDLNNIEDLKVDDILESTLSGKRVKVVDVDLDDRTVIVKDLRQFGSEITYGIGFQQLIGYWGIVNGRRR